MEILGKIKVVEIEKEVGASGFKKREVVITSDEQYPQHISVQFVQDKCEYLDGYAVGDTVKVSINLRGREWINPKGEAIYFNTIQGWKIERIVDEAPQLPKQELYQEPAADFKEEDHDDLPFN
jgi:hypothetical protein